MVAQSQRFENQSGFKSIRIPFENVRPEKAAFFLPNKIYRQAYLQQTKRINKLLNMSVHKKSYKQKLPKNASIKMVKGVETATWVGKGGKKKTAPVITADDGSKKVKLKRNTYTARYRDENGNTVEKSTGCQSKAAALQKLSEFRKYVEKIKSGVVTAEELNLGDWRESGLEDSILKYSDYQTDKGNASVKVATTKSYLLSDAEANNWTLLKHLNSDGLQSRLNQLRNGGNSNATLNQHVAAWSSFGNWLAGKRFVHKRANWNGEKRMAKNPFDGFGRYDEKADPKRDRRALSTDEANRLITAAYERPYKSATTIRTGKRKGEFGAKVSAANEVKLKKTGRERALIYITLILTGLRKGELASITIGQCDLSDNPSIKLKSADEKNRQGNKIPLQDHLAANIRLWIEDKRAEHEANSTGESSDSSESISSFLKEKLFAVPEGLLRILNRDLEWANIQKIDDSGRSIDVHSLRHTFGTLLSTTGADPRVAQEAMRHSDISLTMNVYTDPALLNVKAAVQNLPSFNLPSAAEQSIAEEVAVIDDVSQVRPSEEDSNNMSPNMPPDSCCLGKISAYCSENVEPTKAEDSERTKEKPRENVMFPGACSIGLIGFEPTTSTPPV